MRAIVPDDHGATDVVHQEAELLLVRPRDYPEDTYPALWFTFGSLAASHFWKAFRMGYDTMPDQELKQRARWDLYVLILRAVAMFIMAAHGLYFILVPLMALLLSYFEIWPERVLGAVFGDPSRLYEYDPDDPATKRRRR